MVSEQHVSRTSRMIRPLYPCSHLLNTTTQWEKGLSIDLLASSVASFQKTIVSVRHDPLRIPSEANHPIILRPTSRLVPDNTALHQLHRTSQQQKRLSYLACDHHLLRSISSHNPIPSNSFSIAVSGSQQLLQSLYGHRGAQRCLFLHALNEKNVLKALGHPVLYFSDCFLSFDIDEG